MMRNVMKVRTNSRRNVLALGLLGLALTALAQTNRERLNEYVTELQKSPDEVSLREKIIKLSQQLKPPLEIPEDAKRHMARGKAAFETAKNENDFGDAVSEFKQASLSAPWWGAVYFNLGRAQDKAGDDAAAKASLELYLLSSPSQADAETAKSLIYEIEFKLEKQQAEHARSEQKRESQAATGALLSNMKAKLGRVIYNAEYECSYCNIHSERCNRPHPCNADEYNGRHWYKEFDITPPTSATFPDDGTVVVTTGEGTLRVIGTPKVSIADFEWKCQTLKYPYQQNQWIDRGPAWVSISASGGTFTLSCDRPTNESFNPQVRYNYTQLREE
jgi:hypothetical protein